MNKLVQSEFARPPWGFERLFPGRQLHVSDTCLSRYEFARYQRLKSERDLSDLVWKCRNRCLYAHNLLTPHLREPERLRDGADGDLTGQLYPGDRLCTRYRSHVFDAQIDLFEEQQQREYTRWHVFKQRECFEVILESPANVRCVLQTVDLLPKPDRFDHTAVYKIFENITETIERKYPNGDPTKD